MYTGMKRKCFDHCQVYGLTNQLASLHFYKLACKLVNKKNDPYTLLTFHILLFPVHLAIKCHNPNAFKYQ